MREPLSIAVAQPPCFSYEVAVNALTHAATVRAAGARVVIFPELSLTGYELDAPIVGPADERLEPLVEACAETNSVALVGTVAPGGNIAMLAVDGIGASVVYRKVYLGNAESQWYKPGDKPAVIEVDGWRLGLAICKDTGVPQHAADTVALGIDAYVAGAAEDLIGGAELLAERGHRIAAEHDVWVAIASFAGPTGGGFGQTPGRSRIWAPGGALVAEAAAHPGDLARATLRP